MNDGRKPIMFTSSGRAAFVEMDPYGHVSTQHYLGYYINHRFIGLREKLGWDLKALSRMPVQFVIRKVQIEFIKPLFGDQIFNIESHVQEFKERTCEVTLSMSSENGQPISNCLMELVCVDKKTGASATWPDDIMNKFFEEDGPR